MLLSSSYAFSENNAPVITAPTSITVAATNSDGTAIFSSAIVNFLTQVSAVDDAGGTLNVNLSAPSIFPIGLTAVKFTSTDAAGNIGNAQTMVTITDQTAPVITLIGASSLTLTSADTYSEEGASATDNVDGNLSANIIIAGDIVETSTAATYTVTYNVIDVAGNLAVEQTRSITVQDTTAPVVSAPTNITVAATDATGIANNVEAIADFLLAATAADNIHGIVSVTNDAPDVFPLGITTVTFSSTDNDSNTGTSQATITVVDQTKPSMILVGDASVTVEHNGSYIDAGITANDNVDGNITANIIIAGAVNTSITGNYTLHYNVIDNAGNIADTVTRQISVQDSRAPVVTAPTGITVASTDSDGTAISDSAIGNFLTLASALDGADGVLSVSDNAPTIFPMGVTAVTFTATDTAGNIGTTQSMVTIADQTAPVIVLIGHSSLTLTSSDTYTEQGASATDNVDGNVRANMIIAGDIVDTSTPATYTVTYNVMDATGNSATEQTRHIIVQDTIVPIVTAPPNITVAATDNTGTANSVAAISDLLLAATATDNIHGVVSVSHNAPDVFPLGVTTVTFFATDSDNNTGTSQATVTVNDQTKPSIGLIGDTTITVAHNGSYIDDGVTGNDNVDGNITATIIVTGTVDTSIIGHYTLSYNVVDTAANTADTVIRQVFVQDRSAPVITAPTSITVTATDGDGTDLFDDAIGKFLTQASALDDVDGVVSITNNAPNVFPIGTTTVTFTATDMAENEGVSVANIIIADLTSPVITLTESSVTLTVAGEYTEPGFSALDNVDGDITASVTVSDAVDTMTVGTYIVTYSVVDVAGNPAEVATRIVNVTAAVDTTAPVFPEDIAPVMLDAVGLKTNVKQMILNTNILAIDAVDGEIISVIDTKNLVLASGKHTVTLSATDAAGNVATTEILIYISPLVELGADVIVAAGSQLSIPVKLSGSAPSYPVVIDYSVISITGITTGQVTIEQGDFASEFYVSIDTQAQTGDTVIINLTSATNAVITEAKQLIAHVKNQNYAPTFNVTVEQAEQSVSIISPHFGLVTVTADISDININDRHDVTFEVIDTAFSGEVSGELGNIFSFDPTSINTGRYPLKIMVTEKNSTLLLSTEVITTLYIDTLQDEIAADSDQDGIADNLDSDPDSSRLPIHQNEQPLQVQTGLIIVLGDLAQGSDSASIPEKNIIEDPNFTKLSSITTFIIKGLNVTGNSVPVVLPLSASASIPEGAIYRKFTYIKGWFDFIEDENNNLSSAQRDANGNCPEPGSTRYSSGLTAGDNCIQLFIEDGGANDADGIANGMVVDPGVLVVQHENIAPVITVENLSVFSSAHVKLTATSTGYKGSNMTYTWAQVSGPDVKFITKKDYILFTAPEIKGQLGGVTLAFKVTANDGTTVSTKKMDVNVTKDPKVAAVKSSGGCLGVWTIILLFLGLSRRANKYAVKTCRDSLYLHNRKNRTAIIYSCIKQ